MKLYKASMTDICYKPATLSDLKAALAKHGMVAVEQERLQAVLDQLGELHTTSRDAECELGMLIQAAQED